VSSNIIVFNSVATILNKTEKCWFYLPIRPITMGVYTISDLEKITGIKAHTIRIWERRYNIIEPQRTSTNFRYYCDEDLKRLLNISILCQNGLKIGKIAFFNDEQIKARVVDLCLDTRNQSVQVESLIISMLELDEHRFSEVFTNSVIKMGFEETVELLLFPFLERIGVLWQAGSVYPSQEHFISNLIRQKLIVAIDGEMTKFKSSGACMIFFLPENDFHELSLLFYSLVARKENIEVVYLGSSVPLADIKTIDSVKPAPYLFTTVIASMGPDKLTEYLSNLSKQFSDKEVFITGFQLKDYQSKLPKNIRVVASASDFKKLYHKSKK